MGVSEYSLHLLFKTLCVPFKNWYQTAIVRSSPRRFFARTPRKYGKNSQQNPASTSRKHVADISRKPAAGGPWKADAGTPRNTLRVTLRTLRIVIVKVGRRGSKGLQIIKSDLLMAKIGLRSTKTRIVKHFCELSRPQMENYMKGVFYIALKGTAETNFSSPEEKDLGVDMFIL